MESFRQVVIAPFGHARRPVFEGPDGEPYTGPRGCDRHPPFPGDGRPGQRDRPTKDEKPAAARNRDTAPRRPGRLRGAQAQVPVTGQRGKRVLRGVFSARTGTRLWERSEPWNPAVSQDLLPAGSDRNGSGPEGHRVASIGSTPFYCQP
ncbi:hypothetical protein [Thermoflexus sp.]|uniref:hypothetical protein n=1 Tax=Thermoflexus sp. TaxID=1969742 RepID=UPI0035E40D93